MADRIYFTDPSGKFLSYYAVIWKYLQHRMLSVKLLTLRLCGNMLPVLISVVTHMSQLNTAHRAYSTPCSQLTFFCLLSMLLVIQPNLSPPSHTHHTNPAEQLCVFKERPKNVHNILGNVKITLQNNHLRCYQEMHSGRTLQGLSSDNMDHTDYWGVC